MQARGQCRAEVAGQAYCKSTVWARRKLRRRSTPKTISLSFPSFRLAPEAVPVDGFRSSREPPLAKMLEVSIMTGLPPTFKLTSTIRRYPGASERPGEFAKGLASSTRPVAGVPRSISVWPSITTGSSTVALKLSPACDDALESALCRRIGMGVPSGSFVADGISDWLGEIPVERGWRSKGSFSEFGEFEGLAPETLV